MDDDRPIRDTMRDLGITVREVAEVSGVDPSDLSKQLRGLSHLQRRVRRALVGLLDRRAVAALPHVARLLRDHGEEGAAEACERLWGELHPARAPEVIQSVDGVDVVDDLQRSPHEGWL